MARRPWAGTPKQWAAIRKAQAASVRSARRRRLSRNRGRAPKAENRGVGFAGLKKNFTPYVRVNKRSQTVGFNTGTIWRGTNRRVVYGVYKRIETVNKKNNPVDIRVNKVMSKIAPGGTARGRARSYVKNNVVITNPALRANIGTGAELRVATSRRAGPTVVVRRGRHNKSPNASRKAIKRYDTQMRKIKARKQPKPRPQRRNANRA
jgi:hypothetical protein